jgi:hypothetical protein
MIVIEHPTRWTSIAILAAASILAGCAGEVEPSSTDTQEQTSAERGASQDESVTKTPESKAGEPRPAYEYNSTPGGQEPVIVPIPIGERKMPQ